MFALLDDQLIALPDSLKVNGNTYTDLWTATPDQLAALNIYKLPEMPVYNTNTHELVPNTETKTWDIVPLTSEKLQSIVDNQYAQYASKLQGKYKSYSLYLQQVGDEDVCLVLQIQSYLVDLADYISQVLNREITPENFIEYPEASFEKFSCTV